MIQQLELTYPAHRLTSADRARLVTLKSLVRDWLIEYTT